MTSISRRHNSKWFQDIPSPFLVHPAGSHRRKTKCSFAKGRTSSRRIHSEPVAATSWAANVSICPHVATRSPCESSARKVRGDCYRTQCFPIPRVEAVRRKLSASRHHPITMLVFQFPQTYPTRGHSIQAGCPRFALRRPAPTYRGCCRTETNIRCRHTELVGAQSPSIANSFHQIPRLRPFPRCGRRKEQAFCAARHRPVRISLRGTVHWNVRSATPGFAAQFPDLILATLCRSWTPADHQHISSGIKCHRVMGKSR